MLGVESSTIADWVSGIGVVVAVGALVLERRTVREEGRLTRIDRAALERRQARLLNASRYWSEPADEDGIVRVAGPPFLKLSNLSAGPFIDLFIEPDDTATMRTGVLYPHVSSEESLFVGAYRVAAARNDATPAEIDALLARYEIDQFPLPAGPAGCWIGFTDADGRRWRRRFAEDGWTSDPEPEVLQKSS